MARKLSSLTKLNKDVAEAVAGHAKGRPTISRRVGRRIGRTFGISGDTGTDLFHVALAGGALALIVKAITK